MNPTRTIALIARFPLALLVILLLVGMARPALGAQDVLTTTEQTQSSPDSSDGGESEGENAQGSTDALLRSPRKTMFTFLIAINEYNDADSSSAKRLAMEKAIRCLDLEASLPIESKRNIAFDLYTVLGRIGEVRESHLPAAGPETDQLASFVYFPQNKWNMPLQQAFALKHPGYSISLSKDTKGNWMFDRATLEQIQDFAIETEDDAMVAGVALEKTLMGRIRDAVPARLKGTKSLGLEYWQWLGILVVIFVGLMVDLLVRLILRKGWHRFELKRGREVEKESLQRAVRPFGLLAASGVWYLALELGLLPIPAMVVLLVAVRVVFMTSLVWAAFRVTDLVGDWLSIQASKTETKFDDLLVPMVKRTAKLFLGAIGLIYIASAFSIEIMPLLTGLGIGGLAVAFAAKDTIENFFGSIAVIMDRPFEIGDWIYVNEVEGTVEDLGFRSTRIRTFYNSLVTVPNATLVRAKVDNYGRRQYRRFTTKLNVTYDTHPDKIEAFCSGVREIVKLHPYTRKDYYHVWLNGFGPHSLDILVYIFFECPDWSIELREKHRFMLDVVRLADRLGVEFAFPTQKIHMVKDDPDAMHSPMDVPEANSERRWVLEGRKAARELTAEQPWKHEQPGPVLFAEEFDSEHEARGDSAG